MIPFLSGIVWLNVSTVSRARVELQHEGSIHQNHATRHRLWRELAMNDIPRVEISEGQLRANLERHTGDMRLAPAIKRLFHVGFGAHVESAPKIVLVLPCAEPR